LEKVSLNERFSKEKLRRFSVVARVACLHYSIPIHLLLWIADCIYVPTHKWQFLALRFTIIPGSLLSVFFVEKSKTLRQAQWAVSFGALVNALPVSVMIYLIGNANSLYYTGLLLIMMGIGSFFPWSSRFFVLQVAITFAPCYLSTLTFVQRQSDYVSLFINLFFAMGTVMIAAVIRYTEEKLTLKEFLLRVSRERNLKSRDRIIKRKTEEAIELQKLSKQFSPQIVHAIQSGNLKLNDLPHKATVCAIFIDVVNSTQKIKNMKSENINQVIKLFMEDTMKVMLKYDITVDKFLGDGVLGFSNDPVAKSDYVDRVVEAAWEIRTRIASRQKTYGLYWQDELQIRIGAAVGEATVGFYGSQEYFQSYTALGRPINLASRLCSAAKPGEILLSQSVIQHLKNDRYQFSDLGKVSLKGFESDLEQVFSLIEIEEKDESSDISSIHLCPKGHGVLVLDIDRKKELVFRCRQCDYSIKETRLNKAA
jgi:class 3 adenylate cyclase